jgi:hypothetical protein
VKVFGVGVHRTGTTTLSYCMRRFGFRHCGYQLPLLEAWCAGDPGPLFAAADEVDSAGDWPWPLAFRELDARYPEARFVLTVRRDPQVWLESLLYHARRSGPTRARELIYGHSDPVGHERAHLDLYLAHNAAVRAWFQGRPGKLLEVCWERGDGWPELCGFLGQPIQEDPFPHVNQRGPA